MREAGQERPRQGEQRVAPVDILAGYNRGGDAAEVHRDAAQDNVRDNRG